jgi:precorrin-6B methylase 1
MNDNIPWQCHICKNEFAIEQGKGVICDNCNKPTCILFTSDFVFSGLGNRRSILNSERIQEED